MCTVIREESPSDIAAIHTVTVEAFLNAPHTNHTEQFIIDALRQSDSLTISLVAERDGLVVGHVALSPVTISDGSCGWYGLGPVSVIPDLQGQGIGSLLIKEALQRLRDKGAAGCVLLGDPAYYSRFGFQAEPEIVFPNVPPEYFLCLAFGSLLPKKRRKALPLRAGM